VVVNLLLVKLKGTDLESVPLLSYLVAGVGFEGDEGRDD